MAGMSELPRLRLHALKCWLPLGSQTQKRRECGLTSNPQDLDVRIVDVDSQNQCGESMLLTGTEISSGGEIAYM